MTKDYKTIYADVYKLHSQFGCVPPEARDEEYWDMFHETAKNYHKAHHTRFVNDLLCAVSNELDYQTYNRDL